MADEFSHVNACIQLSARLALLLREAGEAAKATSGRARGDALTWFAVDWHTAWDELAQLPLELFDDPSKPALDRWSGRLRALLIELSWPLGDLAALEEPLPESWRRRAAELLGFSRDLAALGAAPVCVGAKNSLPPANGERVKLPSNFDLLDLWKALQEEQGKGKTDIQIARDWAGGLNMPPTHGDKMLNRLRAARSRKTISDWR